jgi:RimJ/RimL family protein N-acetyltransferase
MPVRTSALPAEVLTSDGRRACLRPPDEGDRAGLLTLHDRLDDEALRLRFFNVSHAAGRHYVDHVLSDRRGRVISLVAVVDDAVVGLGTAELITPDAAEIALVVSDAERGHGLGTLLLEHLTTRCHEAGITRLVADVLPENSRMAQVLRDAGCTLEHRLEHGVVRYELATEVSEAARAATRDRRRFAEERSGPRRSLRSEDPASPRRSEQP